MRSDVDDLRSWHDDWRGLRVVVLGLGVTGFSVADTLVELGARVLVITEWADAGRADLLEVIGARFVVATGLESRAEFDGFGPELVVVSPGFAPSHPLVVAATTAGLPVWGDVELAWRVRDKSPVEAAWICVTGTNGKTTTVQLATAMIAESGRRVVACGNVGVPVLDAIRDPGGFEVLVLELSSFQLHYTNSLEPHSSVVLNVADDHLDWHGSAVAYADAKARVYARTRIACVYNRDDGTTRSMVENAEVADGCRAIGFGLGVPGPSDFGIVEDILCDRAFLDARHTSALEIITADRLEAVGLGSPHLLADVLAASALARSLGVGLEAVRSALDGFRVDGHRTQTVSERGGIRWVDDSKATNPHAAEASLTSFDSVVWVVGGLLKGVALDAIVQRTRERLRAAIVIGVDRAGVLAAFARHAPDVPVFEVEATETERVMPSAVRLSAATAQPGDVVLLAPAAASMDQFSDYADRGRRFADAVREMLGDGPDDDQHPATPAAPRG